MREWTTFQWAGATFAVVSEPGPEAAPALTAAERDVMALVLAGKSNAAIARHRGTSVRTVANQVASLFRKLKVGSRAELAAKVGG
ncbi:MAG: helix-turn-helix transcriptional regulator [Myxococcus sp.]|nr:helix-turn-helix transcriptional regulator [Myxococcus sp.]